MLNMKKMVSRGNSGDTIVEVLMAIAVAAFAIGTSYAIANRSLQQAITARERNQAVNIIQNQISALKVRYAYDTSAFNSDDFNRGFVVLSTTPTPPPAQLPKTAFHFCLDEQSASPTDSTHPWPKQINPFAADSDADNISSTNTYNSRCIRTYDSAQYYIDISAQITAGSQNATDRTVYKVTIRWPQVGSAITAQSVVYYRF